MFDIGFFELLVVFIVGLLVIGPERLPDAVRTTARWWSRLKHMLSNAREELEREIGADDIRREIHNERVMRELRETRREMERTIEEAGEETGEKPATRATPADTQRKRAEEYLPEQEEEADLQDPEYPEHWHDHGDPDLNPDHPDHAHAEHERAERLIAEEKAAEEKARSSQNHSAKTGGAQEEAQSPQDKDSR